MKRHKDSHLDHGLSGAQIDYILMHAVPDGEVTIKTIEIPGTVECALYGPLVGDEPVPEADVTYAVRGERKGASRLVDRPTRPTNKVTFIAGPHDGQEGVLFTAYGGPEAPREPFEFEQRDDFKSLDHSASEAFWKEHALAKGDDA